MLQAGKRRLDVCGADEDAKPVPTSPGRENLSELPRAFTTRQQELSTLTLRLVCKRLSNWPTRAFHTLLLRCAWFTLRLVRRACGMPVFASTSSSSMLHHSGSSTCGLIVLPCALLSLLTLARANALAVNIRDRLEYELELSNFHLCEAADLGTTLKSSITEGLTHEAAAERLSEMGPNTIEEMKTRPLWVKCLLCFVSGFNPLLWVAAFFAFLAWRPFGVPPTDVYNLALAVALLLVIALSSLFSFYQVSFMLHDRHARDLRHFASA